MNCKKPVLGEHLAFLSAKYNVYLAELFEAVVLARKTGEATCEELKIGYRGTTGTEAIILITREEKVVMQFRVEEELLLRKDVSFENWMDTDKIRKQISRQNNASALAKSIVDLRHGMKKINVEAHVLETPKPTLVHTQYGNSAMVTNVWVGDDTGKIKLCLWNEQANLVTVGDTIQIKDASVSSFKGERQLRLGKKGTITLLQSTSGGEKVYA